MLVDETVNGIRTWRKRTTHRMTKRHKCLLRLEPVSSSSGGIGRGSSHEGVLTNEKYTDENNGKRSPLTELLNRWSPHKTEEPSRLLCYYTN